MKPERGETWINLHTGTETKILDRIFFNIQHEHSGIIVYTHYKTFPKHWVKKEEWK